MRIKLLISTAVFRKREKRRDLITKCLACAISILVILNCVYSFKGFAKRKLGSIAISMFKNETTKFGIESEITRAIIDEFNRDSRVIVKPRNEANYILRGTIKSYKHTPYKYDTAGNVQEYKIEAMVDIELCDKSGKKIIKRTIREWISYPVEESESYGVNSLAKKFARTIVTGILELW